MHLAAYVVAAVCVMLCVVQTTKVAYHHLPPSELLVFNVPYMLSCTTGNISGDTKKTFTVGVSAHLVTRVCVTFNDTCEKPYDVDVICGGCTTPLFLVPDSAHRACIYILRAEDNELVVSIISYTDDVHTIHVPYNDNGKLTHTHKVGHPAHLVDHMRARITSILENVNTYDMNKHKCIPLMVREKFVGQIESVRYI
jgi:hypothetical protein